MARVDAPEAPTIPSPAPVDSAAAAGSERVARLRGIRHELAVRAAVSTLILVFNEVAGIGPGERGAAFVRALALVSLLLNGPYYVLARTGWRPRVQAYLRMLVDVTLVTLALYSAGGLAAAHDLSVYVIIPVYTALVFSSTASLVATAYATFSYLIVVTAQLMGWLPMSRVPAPNAGAIVAFNLLVLNVVGVLAAWLAEQYRQSRREVLTLYQELERAHDASMRLAGEIQRTARLYALGEVVAGITHEMRNVLMAATSHTYLLRKRLGPADSESQRHAEHIEHGLANAARILSNVLQTARQPSNERVRMALPEVARRVVDLKSYDARRDGITLRAEFAPAFPPVVAVPFQIEQVLLNLVTNAHEALRESSVRGAIVITGVVAGGYAIAEVRDTGPGIPADVLPRIFEPFYTTKTAGTGLGLAISAGIVHDCGGELTAANQPEGGAVFRVALPVAA